MNAVEVVLPNDFAGGVRGDGESELVSGDSMPVVGDLNQFSSAVFDRELNACRAGIKCVFDEFFDHAGGALDDLTGCDFVDQQVGEFLNGAYSNRHGGSLYHMTRKPNAHTKIHVHGLRASFVCHFARS